MFQIKLMTLYLTSFCVQMKPAANKTEQNLAFKQFFEQSPKGFVLKLFISLNGFFLALYNEAIADNIYFP